MKVIDLAEAEPRPRHVAIGTFDGVHLGHQTVIAGANTVLTFEPHPLSVLHPDKLPKLITPFSVKRDLIAGLGVEELVVIRFDEEFARKSAERFIGEALIERLGATKVSVGENFHFGAEARGDAVMLARHDEFSTRVLPMVEIDGDTVSSSRIRDQIATGDVVGARRCLGAPFMVEGEVVPGDQRGRELGFPTANQVPAEGLVAPAHGVYAAFANGHPAAVNVGVRPTFGSGGALLIETYLIDFEGDLYGQNLRVAFIDRLRGEENFGNVDDLVAQMGRDVERTRELCSEFTGSAGS
jgi:riboflavin kinase/FMN adenylyltransferase